MNDTASIPDDENGAVLRRMFQDGDNLKKPRMIEFSHIFPTRDQALDFAKIVDEKELEVCISYYDERECWDVMVRRYMIPTHEEITSVEMNLACRAETVGGKADGWGCFQIKD